MVYTIEDLYELCRILIQRGIREPPEGADHKHNEVIPGSPKSPIKINLCTSNLRKEAHLTEDDMQKIVHMLWQYVERNRFKVPAIGGIPRVGERFALMLQEHVLEQTGRKIPVVCTTKIERADGSRKIGDVIPSKEYPSGDIWLIDDLVNWGYSKQEAFDSYEKAGYHISDVLVALDYGVGASKIIADRGARLHSLLQLDSVLIFGAQEKIMDLGLIARIKAYLAASRLAIGKNQTPPQP